jgi:hypothetical protein
LGDDPLVAVRSVASSVVIRGVSVGGLLDLGEPAERDHDVETVPVGPSTRLA